MRSFAVIAGLAAAANAYAYGSYEEKANATSVAPPAYGASTPAGYAASSAPPAAYYPASSAPPAYMTTEFKKTLSTVCPGSTTMTVGTKTYTVTKSTTIVDDDCEYTTSYMVKPTPATMIKGTPIMATPYTTMIKGTPVMVTPVVHPTPYSTMVKGTPIMVTPSVGTPIVGTPIAGVPYPSKNGTVPAPPAGTAAPSGSATKSAPPSQFTGAAAQTGAAMLAIVGAVAAFL